METARCQLRQEDFAIVQGCVSGYPVDGGINLRFCTLKSYALIIHSFQLAQFGCFATLRPHTSDEELEAIIAELFQEAERIADLRNGFTEGDIQEISGRERSW